MKHYQSGYAVPSQMQFDFQTSGRRTLKKKAKLRQNA